MHLYISLSIYMSIYLSIYLSIYPSIYIKIVKSGKTKEKYKDISNQWIKELEIKIYSGFTNNQVKGTLIKTEILNII